MPGHTLPPDDIPASATPLIISQSETHIVLAVEIAKAMVLTTQPTTLAGVAAVLEHCGLPRFPDEQGASRNDSILRDASLCFRKDVVDVAKDFLPTIAATLRKFLPA
jgi:hypothetical protein